MLLLLSAWVGGVAFVGLSQTCILTVSPLAKGLFHRAIVQSGSCISRDWGPTNPTQGDSFVLAMLDAVGASSLEDLRNATKFPTEVFVWPKVDGRVGLPTFGDVEAMPVDPREAFAHNDLNVNALLIGATTYDGLVRKFCALLHRVGCVHVYSCESHFDTACDLWLFRRRGTHPRFCQKPHSSTPPSFSNFSRPILQRSVKQSLSSTALPTASTGRLQRPSFK